MDELKPCPFCGQQAEVGRFGNPRLSTIIECTNCGSRVESSDQHPDHARSWNTRPVEDALRAEAARLTAAERAVENLRPEVLTFALAMETKLRANDHKGGWEDETSSWLFRRLLDETGELRRAVFSGDRPATKDEAVDVANFAMMLFNNNEEASRG